LIVMWQLSTTIAHHYMHMLEMMKKGFIKNKVMEAIVTWNVEKTAFIPFTHVYQPTFGSDGVWGIWNQCHLCNEIPIHQNILSHIWMGIVKEHV
jgi:hypothetical protein